LFCATAAPTGSVFELGGDDAGLQFVDPHTGPRVPDRRYRSEAADGVLRCRVLGVVQVSVVGVHARDLDDHAITRGDDRRDLLLHSEEDRIEVHSHDEAVRLLGHI
jgi:hypothetical protein